MITCAACKSEDVIRSKNDCGHFKPERGQPIRMYQWRCDDCGHIAVYAMTPEQEAKHNE